MNRVRTLAFVSPITAALIPEELLSISVRMVGAENRVVDCRGC